MALQEILSRLSDRLDFLAARRRRGGRHRSLHAAIEWSHDHLSDDERLLLRRLYALPGD